MLYAWHKRNNLVRKYTHDSKFNICILHNRKHMCLYQIMDLYKNIAPDVNKFILYISQKETSELLSFPQNDQHSQNK
jgi:hypothetical protein